jgi:hypothetical protein
MKGNGFFEMSVLNALKLDLTYLNFSNSGCGYIFTLIGALSINYKVFYEF